MTKIVTHDGHFHADELLAVAALLLKYPDAEVVRSRDEAVIKTGDIVVDVGQVYDPAHGRFDHHQTEGAGKRDNGIPYASFGLVWKEFGAELAGGEEEAQLIEEKIVMPVDALDNSIEFYAPEYRGVIAYTLSDYFESFAYGKPTLEEVDKSFFEVLPLAQELLQREIERAQKSVVDRREVEHVYRGSSNKRVIVLPRAMSWKRALIPTEAEFVIYPRTDGQWGVQGVPKQLHLFEVKRKFPTAWAGLENGDFAEVSGVIGARFCHRGGWMLVAGTQEAAIKLAEIALNS